MRRSFPTRPSTRTACKSRPRNSPPPWLDPARGLGEGDAQGGPLLLETMELTAIPAEDEALREPVRAFLREALADMPPSKRSRSWMGFDRDFSKALAAKGWVGLTLPKDCGGGGR